MTKEKKLYQVKRQVTQILKDALPEILKMSESAMKAGCLSDQLMNDNFILSKILIKIYFDRNPYTTKDWGKEIKHLERFI